MIFFSLIFSVFISNAGVLPSLMAPKVIAPYENQVTDMHGPLTAPFPKTYEEARTAFRLACEDIVKEFNGQLGSYKIPNHVEADLTIEHIFIPAPKKSDKLLIVTSGIHGAEAYAGHAVEVMLLKDIRAARENYPFNILIVHGLNPFGFKYFRRTNENNVDLNRNFAQPEQFKSENKNYKKLRRMFNPKGQANSMWIAQTQFYISALWNRLIRGKKTILGGLSGQYQDSTGPFYGGNTAQAETLFAQYLIKKYGAFASTIYHIDLHTGFGEKGRMHLLSSKKAFEAQPGGFRKLFDGFEVNTGDDKDFYETTGDLIEWTRTSFPDKVVLPITWEFGTMDSQTTMGGITSLWTMVIENQGYQHGYNSQQSGIIGRGHFEDLFNPQNREWQGAVIRQAKEGLDKTLARFKAL